MRGICPFRNSFAQIRWPLRLNHLLLAFVAAAACGRSNAQPRDLTAEDRQKVEEAIPIRAEVSPQKPRRLLIFDRNVNYGGHSSIPTANYAFTLMGRKTGAFETEVSREPAVFKPDSLRRFDAVFFNNTVGNLFEDRELRQSLVDFVYAGGGLLGVHGTSVGFTQWPGAIEDWPEFGLMLGARGANHKSSTERVFIHLDDAHPLNRPFDPSGFEYADEFFRVQDPYSRRRVRVLLTIDTEKTDMNQTPAYGKLIRADHDYALAWVRNYGRGRTFYCTIAHNPYVFWDRAMLRFYLGAIQFALGDLPAPTIPSALVTDAVRAQEKLQWRLALESRIPKAQTLFETIEQAAELGVPFVGASRLQKVSEDIRKPFDEQLASEEWQQIRLKLDSAGVRLLSYSVGEVPADSQAREQLLAFVHRIGVESLLCRVSKEGFSSVLTASDESKVPVVFCEEGAASGLESWVTQNNAGGKRVGLGVALSDWARTGTNSREAIRSLGPAIGAVELSGRQTEADEALLAELQRSQARPLLFTLDSSRIKAEGPTATKQAIDSFNRISLQLATSRSAPERR